jgi:ArsR family transcriptional regulator, arsenate/arsenite/antimonite-responsive transcriptional repressor / arsenate reductase (thioredoxin)
MESSHLIEKLSALAHPGRLAVFRLLVRMAPLGGRPTEIAAALSMRPNTLSHHLAALEAAALISAKRQGRSLLYSAQMGAVQQMMGDLVNDCCRGRPDACALVPATSRDTFRQANDRPFAVLFICTGNSARSLMAETILRDLGGSRFLAFSAGTNTARKPNPQAIAVLERQGHITSGLRPKPLSQFLSPDAPVMDFSFTLCDRAAAEDCKPLFGHPLSAHWGLADPAEAKGTSAEQALAFIQIYNALYRRIAALVALPFAQLDRLSLQTRIDDLASDTA